MYTLKLSQNIFNGLAKSGNFPDILKYYTSFLKSWYDRQNFSKILEKLIFTQINSSFIKSEFSKPLADFRKNHVTQYTLLKIIGKLDSMLNKRNKARAIVIDFSKVFDTLNQNVLLCKLKACGFDTNAFSNTHQIIKLGDKFNKSGNISKDPWPSNSLNTFY